MRETPYYRLLPHAPATPGWEYVACPLCRGEHTTVLLHGRDYLHGVDGRFTVVRCDACGFAYTNPRPFGAALERFYPDSANYFRPDVDPAADCTEVLRGRKYRLLCRHLGYGGPAGAVRGHTAAARRLLREGYPLHVPGGRLVEIGCSYGKFLHRMRCLGWEVEGVEPNAAAAQFARTRLGIPVQARVVEEAALAPETFDAAVMRMSLEHVASPLDVLHRVHAALKPGGQLLVIVPNFACHEARHFGEHYYNLHLPAHMSHFTPATLRRALELSGFQAGDCLTYSSSNDVLGSARLRAGQTGADLLLRLGRHKWFERLLLRPWFRYTRWAGKGCRMTIHAHKAQPGTSTPIASR